MITRGHFIGEIIDELSAIAHQVESRCQLGLTDLNVYLENFFRDILNKTLGFDLRNLNDERSNEPGLDLGDEVTKKAFQITSQSTSAKVNNTLEKYSAWSVKPYEEVYILIIGRKQGSYTISNAFTGFDFKEKNIWDINTLCKKILDLPLDKLQGIYEYIKREVARVKIELEIPSPEGTFDTSISSYVESIPKPRFSDFSIFYAHNQKNYEDCDVSIEDIKKDFILLSKELAKLPRITREFLAFLLERRDLKKNHHSNIRFNDDRLRRICRYSDLDGELRLLSDHGMLDFNEPDEFGESPYVRVFVKKVSEGFLQDFIEFVEVNKIGYQKPIVNLDFSIF